MLAENLQSLGGYITKRKKETSYWIIIKKADSLYRLILLINGWFVPKIEALHRLIIWYNDKHGTKIPLLGIDLSPLGSNSWLAGILDAGCSFILIEIMPNLKRVGFQPVFNTICDFLKDKTTISFIGSSYFVIMLTISSFLSVSLKSKSRNHLVESGTGSKTFIEQVYLIRTENFRSKYILISYWWFFPFLSYKYNAISVFRDLLAISLAKKKVLKKPKEN